MSMSKQKRQVALDYLLDGKDRLSEDMKLNYKRQYQEFLFSEKNVLKNMRDANAFILKNDKTMNSLSTIDKKELKDKPSIYATYFTQQGNTAPVSPKKMNKEDNLQGGEILQNIKIENNNTSQILETNQSNISNKSNAQLNELLNTQLANLSLLRDDKLFIDSVQQNNLQSMQMHNALRIKQLREKQTAQQSLNSGQSSFKTGQSGNTLRRTHLSSSLNQFQPYGNERSSLGFIIDPITEFGIEQQSMIKKKLSNFPIESQRISLIVPPSEDKVLVMKRGVHFFEQGIQLKSKRDENQIMLTLSKNGSKLANEKSFLTSISRKQVNKQKENENNLYEKQIAANINTNRISDNNSSILSTQIYPANTQHNHNLSMQNSAQQQHNSADDQNSLLKAGQGKVLQKSELSSSNYLVSNTTTFHNSTQVRNNSQDSVLPSIDNSKFNPLNKANKHLGSPQAKYYITPSMSTPQKDSEIHQAESELNLKLMSDYENQNQNSQIIQASSILQQSLIDNSKYVQMQNDSQILNNQSLVSLCANPSYTNNLHVPEIPSQSNQIEQQRKGRKGQSLTNIRNLSSTNIANPTSNAYSQSKTMLLDKNDKRKRLVVNNDIVVEEKQDCSTSIIGNKDNSTNNNNNNNNSQRSIKYMEVNMKQNKGGEVSEFNIGKFMIATDQNSPKNAQGEQINEGLRQASPPKKTAYNNNVYFKWRMNALDEAQLIELIRKEKESKVKLPKISIYNKKKYTSDQYPAPGVYNPQYSCTEKHTRLVFFDKANSIIQPQPAANSVKKQDDLQLLQLSPYYIAKSKSEQLLQKYIRSNKEEGHEIMFSELMKDIKKEVRSQKTQNKELQHPMQGLLLSAIPHANIIDLNKDMSSQISYCKQCLNNIKYYLRADNPTFQKKQMYQSRNS